MPNPTIRIHNAETGETIDREMTVAEYKTYKEEQDAYLAKEIEIKAKREAALAKLAALGLTPEDLAAL